MTKDTLKRSAAERATEFVESGMILGLGTGSTVFYALRRLGEQISRGELSDIAAVPTSSTTAERAREFGIPLTTLDEHQRLDLTIDGADEVDPDLNLIKGLGGALLWEKIVAVASRKLIIAVDESKLVMQLGTHVPLPVEVVPFGWRLQMTYLEALGATPTLRRTANGEPYVTDSGHYIIDCQFAGIDDPYTLATTLSVQPGIVENGLFLDMADLVVVGSPEGVSVISRD
ncbi:MAG: ribose-5-phosphate isomerase RpiA [Chloroflexi bacterium]|nr:MAG: ribose-5-phosphate isomerase RpiA [Chloroflexota bacterium]